jgi:DNA-binding HxlR family transcriptional regulator
MSLEVKIHDAQTIILRDLLFHPSAGFSELQRSTGLTSDYFNFHITKLVELGLVDKVSRGKYKLSAKGKEYANRLDTDNNTIERQPKSAVILALQRQTEHGLEYLFQERLKNPYFGFWGFPSGKMRWGESILDAARRECLEETGLMADFEVKGIYHERVLLKETGEMMEDKIFYVCGGTNVQGDLAVNFEGGYNAWMTNAEAMGQAKKFDSLQVEIDILTSDEWLIESLVTYDKANF